MVRLILICALVATATTYATVRSNSDSDNSENTISKSAGKSTILFDYQTRIVAYKDLIDSRCLLGFLNNGENFIGYLSPQPDFSNLTKKYYLAQKPLTKKEILTIAGHRVQEFCRGFPTFLIHELNVTEQNDNYLNDDINNNNLYRRKRSTKHFFVGRVRGQTQSQYLNFGNGNSPGKAEAESTYGGSKAVVSGNSGMGQAQSQSAPVGCDECYGQDETSQYGQPGLDGGLGSQYADYRKPGTVDEIKTGQLDHQQRLPQGPPISTGPGLQVTQPGRTTQLGQTTQPGYPSQLGQPGYPSTVGSQPGTYPPGYPSQPGIPAQPGYTPGYAPGGISQQPGYVSQPGYPRQPLGPGGYPSSHIQPPGHLAQPGYVDQSKYPPQTGYLPPGGYPPGYPGQISDGRYTMQPGQDKYPSQPSQPAAPSQVYSQPGIPSGIQTQPGAQPGVGPSGPAIGSGYPTYQPGYGAQPGFGIQTHLQQPGVGTSDQINQMGVIQGGQPSTTGQFGGQLSGDYNSHTGQRGQFSGKFSGVYETYGNGKTTGIQDHTRLPIGPEGQYIGGSGISTQTYDASKLVSGPSYPQTYPSSQDYRPGYTTSPGTHLGSGQQYVHGTQGPTGTGQQYTPVTQQPIGPGTQYVPGSQRPTGSEQQYLPGTQLPGGSGVQYIPGSQRPAVSGQQYISGGQGSTGSGQQYIPGSQGPTGPGQQYNNIPGSQGPTGPGQQYLPGSHGSTGPGQQYLPGGQGSTVSGQQYIPGGQGSTSYGQQHIPGSQGPIGPGQQYPPGTQGSTVPGQQYLPGGQGSTSYGQQHIPGSQGPTGPGQQYQPGGQVSTLPAQQYIPGGQGSTGSGQQYIPGGQGSTSYGQQHIPGSQGPTGPGQQYPPGGQGSTLPGQQYIPGTPGPIGSGHQYIPGGQVSTGSGQQYIPGSQGPTGSGQQYIPGGPTGGYLPSQQYPSGYPSTGVGGQQTGSTISGLPPGGTYPVQQPGTSISELQYRPGQPPTSGQLTRYPPGSSPPYTGYPGGVQTGTLPDGHSDDSSQVQTSVQAVENETLASASAQGKHAGGTAQSQVSGTYSGSGSFSASAGSDDGKRGALTQVAGGKHGAQSAAQGRGGLGQSQAQVQLASETGDTISSAQTGGWNHGSQTQVQASGKGGMADAQANGPGSTSSQAQIGFSPYEANERTNQTTPFKGGGTASAQSGSYSGQAQSQIQGNFQYGIRYVGAAQAGSGGKTSAGGTTNRSIVFGTFPKLRPMETGENVNRNPLPVQKQIITSQQIPTSTAASIVTTKNNQPREDSEDMYTDETVTEEYHEEEYDYDYTTRMPRTKSIISQVGKHQSQHIVLAPLEDLDATVHQSTGNFPVDGTILQPGQIIPGSPGYQIPAGFRGRVKSIANGHNTYTSGRHSQAQSVTLTPGQGHIVYRKPVYAVSSNTLRNGHIGFGSGYTYQPVSFQLKSGKSLPNFVSMSKSETGSRNPITGQKTPSVFYTQSSSCGVFTNTCVFNGTERLCFPRAKTNPDGSFVSC